MNVKWVLVLRTLACAALLTAPPGSRAAAAFSETELTPGDFFGFRHFGTAVAIDGDTAVVGVPQDPEAGFDAGAAYVYLRTGSTWSQQAKLMAADAAGSSEFGSSVAISGDTLVVGAPFTAAGGVKVGAAYAFVRSGTTWMQQAKLVPTDAIGDDLFGASVAIDGETLAVGAIGTGQDYFDEGAVYVYARSGGTWTQQARLRSSQPGPGNAFGFSLALNNGVL